MFHFRSYGHGAGLIVSWSFRESVDQDSGSWKQGPGCRFQEPGTGYQEPGTTVPVLLGPASRVLVPESRILTYLTVKASFTLTTYEKLTCFYFDGEPRRSAQI